MPGRFNSAVFVAEKRLDAGFGAVQAELADLLYRGALATRWVDTGEGSGEEGGASADRQEGSASDEASWEDGEIALARTGRCRERCRGTG